VFVTGTDAPPALEAHGAVLARFEVESGRLRAEGP
jgi:hypothetical protein